jgi:hypothetical protein
MNYKNESASLPKVGKIVSNQNSQLNIYPKYERVNTMNDLADN